MAVVRRCSASLCAGTLRAYGPAVASYRSYAAGIGLGAEPSDVTPAAVASWMGWLAKQGKLKASTIDGYSSAVSTWHKWGTLSDSVDIGHSTAVSLVRAGIHKSLKIPSLAVYGLPWLLFCRRYAMARRAMCTVPAVSCRC